MQYRGLLSTLLALSVCLLASCASQPTEEKEPSDDALLSERAVEDRIKELTDRARDSESPEREAYLLEAAELLIEQEEYDWARNLLTSIDTRQLDSEAFVFHAELLGTVALNEGAYFLAGRILTNPRLEQQWSSLDPEREVALRELRAALFQRTGAALAAVRERIRLGSVLEDEQAHTQNRERLWQQLMVLSRPQLEEALEDGETETLSGWLELAQISKDNQANLERQQAQLEQWQKDWPEHPANQPLPNDLQLLQKLIEQQPRQIALLLPEQGNLARAADAVRDGFLAAYYQSRNEQAQVPQIRQYDTSDEQGVIELYQQAVSEGADLIIGPLDKEKVAALHDQSELPTPVLTLNYLDSAQEEQRPEGPEHLYQFGLAAEDEARQIARRGHEQGHRNAMILSPDRNWSRRAAQAFTREWEAQDGKVLVDTRFGDQGDYSRIIQRALAIDQSQARHQALTRLLGSSLEFEPRRRQDLDMIFLMADPEQGRQIRPTLSFHYAGDLPVYATSHIYTGEQNRKDNQDLNGVRFNTLPWLLDGEFAEKVVLREHSRDPAVYGRLHALGVDAYRLYRRLPQLAQIEDARLYGATGALRMRPGRALEREQVWAQFQAGMARPLTTTSGLEALELKEELRDDLQPPDQR